MPFDEEEIKTAEDHLLVPWLKRIDYLDSLSHIIYEASLIVGVTGQGKTHQTSKVIVPELFNCRTSPWVKSSPQIVISSI